jgi:acetyl esterase/lipase
MSLERMVASCTLSGPGRKGNKLAEDRSVLSRGAQPPDDTVAYGADPAQTMEVRVGREPAVQRPLVVLIHGGFWRPDIDRVHMRVMADALAAAGWTSALPEYARVARDPAPTLADLTLLLSQVAGKVPHYNGKVILVGHSAGGHLALWAAATGICPQLAGTLALAPAADLLLAHELGLGGGAVSRFLGADPVSRPDIDPRQLAAPLTAATIVHGMDDETVPLVVSESYVAAHPQVRLRTIPGAGHFEVIDPLAPAWSAVIEELSRLSE